jgi:hypothetical protein
MKLHKKYTKHKINIYPIISDDTYGTLKESLMDGFNPIFPIILYEDKVLDGWNRYLICEEMDIEPTYQSI